MKGHEDLLAGLLLLVVILIGGYTYLNSQVIKQREVLQVPAAEKKIVIHNLLIQFLIAL
jgi:hypothetical protein